MANERTKRHFPKGDLRDQGPLVLPGPEVEPSALQGSVDPLRGHLEGARRNFTLWRAHHERIGARITAEKGPLLERRLEVERRLVGELDRHLVEELPGAPPLTAIQREALTVMLCSFCERILAAAADPELEALHDRYSSVPYGELGALAPRRGRAPAEAEAEGEVDVEAEADLDGVVGAVYRRLLCHLEDDNQFLRDRGDDLGRSARRIEMIEEAHRAFAGRDLLALMELEIEREALRTAALPGSDPWRSKRVPRDHLEMLRQQSRALREALEDWLGQPLATRASHPGPLDQLFDRQLAELGGWVAYLEMVTDALGDPQSRSQCLAALVDDYVAVFGGSRAHGAAPAGIEGFEEAAAMLDAKLDAMTVVEFDPETGARIIHIRQPVVTSSPKKPKSRRAKAARGARGRRKRP